MRLTKASREAIVKAVVVKATAKKEAKLIEDYRALVRVIAENRHPKHVRDWIAAAPKLDKPLLGVRSEFELIDVRPALCKPNINIGTPLPVLRDEEYYGLKLDVPGKYRARLKRILDAMKKLDERKVEINATITQAVHACNTSKQLTENYPSLAEFLPKMETANFPAIPSDVVAKVVADAKKAA